jgi:hypothetical protein
LTGTGGNGFGNGTAIGGGGGGHGTGSPGGGPGGAAASGAVGGGGGSSGFPGSSAGQNASGQTPGTGGFGGGGGGASAVGAGNGGDYGGGGGGAGLGGFGGGGGGGRSGGGSAFGGGGGGTASNGSGGSDTASFGGTGGNEGGNPFGGRGGGGGGAGLGGAIFVRAGTLTLFNTRLTKNTATGGAGGTGAAGGTAGGNGQGKGGAIFINTGATVRSPGLPIFSGNTAANASTTNPQDNNDYFGTLSSVNGPFSLSATGGTPQSTVITTAFAQPLQVTLLDDENNPVPGVVITFSGPGSGPGATLSSPLAVTDAVGHASVTATADAAVGIYTVTASVGTLSATFSLTNLAPTTTAPAAASATYSPAAQTVTLSASVTSPAGMVGGGSVTFTVTRGATVIGTPVTAPVLVSGWPASASASADFTLPGGTAAGDLTITADYNPGATIFAPSTGTATLSVVKADQTITFDGTGPVTYGVAPITLTATASSGLPASFTVVSGPGTLSGGVLTVTGAGSVVIQADQDGNGNNNPAPPVQQTLVVTPAPLTVTADDASKVYGAALPAFTAGFSGFVNGDTPVDLGGSLSLGTPATAASPVATYPVTPSGLSSPNYTITFIDGTLTITPAPLTVTANDASKVYGAALPTFTAGFSGLVNGDTPADLGGTLTFATPADANSAPGAYPITPSGLTSANYDITFADGTLTVGQADQSIDFTLSGPVVYGAAPITLTATATSGLPVSFTVVSGPGTLTGGVLTVTGAGTIVIRADQPGNGNYNPAPSVQRTLVVTPAPLTVTANDAGKLYGAALPAFTAGFSGFVNGDTPADLDGTLALATPATAASPVGTYPVTPGGLTSPNYTITFADGTLTVTRAPLTVTANDASRVFGRPNPTFTASYTGLVGGDAPADLGGTLTFSTAADANSPAGTYPVTPSGLSSPNYTITFANGTLTVTPALPPLVVSGPTDGTAVVFDHDPATGLFATTPATTVGPFGGTAVSVRGATADVDGDGFPDTVLVTGPGTPTRVAVLSGKDGSTLVAPFDPFGDNFTGGGFVAAADLDGDGRAELVVSPDVGGGARVVVFSLAGGTPALRRSFLTFADDPTFRGGARVALGDVNGDGTPDLAVAAGFLGGPRVALFDGQTVLSGGGPEPTRLVNDFFAFPGPDAATLRNGVFVSIGDVDGDGKGDLIFGGGPGGAPRVSILSGALVSAGDIAAAYAAPVANFFVAGDSTDRGGVRVAAVDADRDGRADVATGSGEGSQSRVRVYRGKDFTSTAEPSAYQDLDPFGQVLPGGVFVG